MSISRLAESIRRAAEGIDEPLRILLSELTDEYGAPPPSTIRRIIRDWDDSGVDLGGHRVTTEKKEGRLFLVIDPASDENTASATTLPRRRPPVMSIPLYHQFGRVLSA
jgi:hypothetical protein